MKTSMGELNYPYSPQSDVWSYDTFAKKNGAKPQLSGGASVKMFSREQLPVKAALADNLQVSGNLACISNDEIPSCFCV